MESSILFCKSTRESSAPFEAIAISPAPHNLVITADLHGLRLWHHEKQLRAAHKDPKTLKMTKAIKIFHLKSENCFLVFYQVKSKTCILVELWNIELTKLQELEFEFGKVKDIFVSPDESFIALNGIKTFIIFCAHVYNNQ